MTGFEYKVVPAPNRGKKHKGVKGHEARFAYAMQCLLNEMAQESWEFQRAETLPSEERASLTQSTTTHRNLLVFRRHNAQDVAAFSPTLLQPADPGAAQVTEVSVPMQPVEPDVTSPDQPAAPPVHASRINSNPERPLRPSRDNGVDAAETPDEDDDDALSAVLLSRVQQLRERSAD